MGWSPQIPLRTGWYWVRSRVPNEVRVVYLDYQSSSVYDGLKPPEPKAAAPIFEYCRNGRGVEWYSAELRPPPL